MCAFDDGPDVGLMTAITCSQGTQSSLKPTRLKVWGAEWTVRLCRFFTNYASTHSTSFQVNWIPGYSVFDYVRLCLQAGSG